MKKLLVANRGEIAVRVMRAARELGIRTVAVYSEADAESLHARSADEAVCIGPPEAGLSYLDSAAILRVCKETGADALHPGYGFLSERAGFVEECVAAGVTFVGPPASAMRRLGAKIDAKQLAVENGVPITPGYFESGADAATLKAKAAEIGYPVMLKASAGGGGRGMRPVGSADEFDSACKLAMEEAEKAFGDSSMMVEKLVERPRHIEVQVLADSHGQVVCLFERECSIQRRHQKLIEEAGSPAMTDEMWSAMRESATKLCHAAGYVGAGTVEFMVDPESGEFYFLEVNARLQVEHPVTEAVTGTDLVEWQLRIARGERLDLSAGLLRGDRSALVGHSIEARIVAEDPAHGFVPSVGRLLAVAPPCGPGIRFDTGFEAGCEISRHYDSLIGKLVVHASTREGAIRRMVGALKDCHILGVKTNIGFLIAVLQHEGFVKGEIDTGFLGRHFADWAPPAADAELVGELLPFALGGKADESVAVARVAGAWGVGDGFRNAAPGSGGKR